MYADLDGDGKISNGTNKLGDTGDYRIIGNSTPRFKYGITLDAAWKGFDFSIFMQGVGKRDLWLDGCYFWEPTDKEMNGNLPDLLNIGISSVRKVTR